MNIQSYRLSGFYRKSALYDKQRAAALIVFCLSPLLAVYTAIKEYKSSHAKNIIWAFVVFYGYTLVISNTGIDANRVRDKLISFHNSDISIGNTINLFYAAGEGYLDVVQPLIIFIISLFTDNYNILFAVYGFIFGYFYSRNIWYLLSKLDIIKKEYILFIFTFAFIIGFWDINGFRMWTAAQVFFYGAIRYLIDRERKGLFIALLSILFHFSFLLPVSILLIFMILGNRINIYFWLFIATFFISELDLYFVRQKLLAVLPDLFHNKVMGYTQEGYDETRIWAFEQMNWYVKFHGLALRWVVITFLSIIYFRIKDYLVINKKEYLPLLGFSFLFLGVANIARFVPAGGRFMAVASLFGVALIFLVLNQVPRERIIDKIMPVVKYVLIFYFIISLRLAMDTIGLMAIFGNPILAAFVKINIALIQLFK